MQNFKIKKLFTIKNQKRKKLFQSSVANLSRSRTFLVIVSNTASASASSGLVEGGWRKEVDWEGEEENGGERRAQQHYFFFFTGGLPRVVPDQGEKTAATETRIASPQHSVLAANKNNFLLVEAVSKNDIKRRVGDPSYNHSLLTDGQQLRAALRVSCVFVGRNTDRNQPESYAN
ncbi:hypothetical protein L596_001439 [Steinernema carpocapsae]|uniref:Uncharacterized protein n=1 Tax=Steinernema carpocapsae TaxID=34508 RepID=A0A4U8ULK5_STECR|nr:hypothetical protein L596_001439 [Steinernema carpocapsae]